MQIRSSILSRKRIWHKKRTERTERSLQTSQESHERDIDLFLHRHIKLGDSDGQKKLRVTPRYILIVDFVMLGQ